MAVDFSPLFAPVPESGTSRGLSFLSNTLDAVLQRRAAMEQQKAAQAQAEAHFQQNLAFQQQVQKNLVESRKADDARADEAAKALAEKNRLERERQDREDTSRVVKDVGEMAGRRGGGSLARSYLAANEIGFTPKDIADPSLRQPIAQPEPQPLPFLPMQPEQARAIGLEQKRREDLAAAEDAVRGVGTLNFRDGRTADLDLRGLGIEGAADAIAQLQQTATDPRYAEALGRMEGGVRSGAIKPEQAGALAESSLARDKNAEDAMKRTLAGANARASTMDLGAAARLKESQLSSARSAYAGWADSQKVPALTERYQRVRDLNRAVDDVMALGPKAVVQQREVLFNIAKQLSGPGVLTQGDIEATVKNTAGFTAKIMSQLKTQASGQLGEDEWAALERYVRNARKAVRDQGLAAVKNFDTRFQKSDYMRDSPDEVASLRATLMDGLQIGAGDLEASKAGKSAADDVADKFLKRGRR